MTVFALEQEAKRGRVLEKPSVDNQLAIILDTKAIQLIPADKQDECMTVNSRNKTTLLTFDGTTQWFFRYAGSHPYRRK